MYVCARYGLATHPFLYSCVLFLNSEVVSIIHFVRPSLMLSISILDNQLGSNSITKLFTTNFMKHKMLFRTFSTYFTLQVLPFKSSFLCLRILLLHFGFYLKNFNSDGKLYKANTFGIKYSRILYKSIFRLLCRLLTLKVISSFVLPYSSLFVSLYLFFWWLLFCFCFPASFSPVSLFYGQFVLIS